MIGMADKIWYRPLTWQWLLYPFALVYQAVTALRRWYLQRFCQINFPVPVIVIGNISVGGVGKTPLVIAVAKKLREKGLRVGIVSRGYGAGAKYFPYEVRCEDSALMVGDEPLLLAQKTLCPVVIAPKRTEAIAYLLEKYDVQVIISDDGLQHYRMGRAIEIAVVDGLRGFGNGLCLPAGPLRESVKRLKQVDAVVVNEGKLDKAYSMRLQPGKPRHLSTDKERDPEAMTGSLAAVAGIGNPQRFYTTLSQLGLVFTPYAFPDHYQYKPHDLCQQESMIILTEKDAVKCRLFDSDKLYYLPVEAVLESAFWDALWSHQQLQGCIP